MQFKQLHACSFSSTIVGLGNKAVEFQPQTLPICTFSEAQAGGGGPSLSSQHLLSTAGTCLTLKLECERQEAKVRPRRGTQTLRRYQQGCRVVGHMGT
mmetsp:Transcript_43048/g.111466  ORF Transcript_43048/g.111466 Transcript_43048/m.111466 type:complete len:98 (+) Transcript_43048:515-808(+)